MQPTPGLVRVNCSYQLRPKNANAERAVGQMMVASKTTQIEVEYFSGVAKPASVGTRLKGLT